MNLAPKIALAAVLAAAAAAPAAADEWWTYRGGPKAVPSLGSPDYGGAYAYYDGPYAGPGYGGPYAYYGPRYGYGYRDGYGYRGRVNEPLYRCTGPATSDCYNSRALQGTR
jgi:opacity protein-like surface antigen